MRGRYLVTDGGEEALGVVGTVLAIEVGKVLKVGAIQDTQANVDRLNIYFCEMN